MRQAFTLVELAIVLVIIGLLVGGVLTGADLIKSAQLYALNRDKVDVVTAAMTFRDKYGRMPGDWMHATDTFGILAGTGADATCQNTPTPAGSIATCNGNGNDHIDTSVVSGDEMFRFYQQLGAAGLIKGNYTGTSGTNSSYTNGDVATVNMPETHRAGTVMFVGYSTGFAGNASLFAYSSGHVMYFIYAPPATGATLNSYIFTPSDDSRLDAKFDDGFPGTGLLVSNKGDGTANFCTNKAGTAPPGDAGAIYNLSDGNIDCNMTYLRVF
ncbi:MAG: prepilin-type N-terminal cleavage/methylation domain-containing protein [Alphaproteobacteria bacterium]